VVCVGVSVTLPSACELASTFLIDVPAVIVTDVALVLCQLSVTVCPEMIEVGLADRVTVGAGVPEPLSPQPDRPAKTSGIAPQMIQRTDFVLIDFKYSPECARHQMPNSASLLVSSKYFGLNAWRVSGQSGWRPRSS